MEQAAGTSRPTMQAVRLHGPADARVESLPRPRVEDGRVLLRMRSVGLCGSDLHQFREGSTDGTPLEEPLVLGHEIAAEVTAESAGSLGLAPGTLVAVDPAHPCGQCEWCRRGHANLCPNVHFHGVAGHPGGLAEYLTARPEQVVSVPDELTADEVALLEPLGVALHALDLARLRPADTVVVLGAGPIGLLLLQGARYAGVGCCYAIDPLEYRTDRALRLGADAAAQHHERIAEWTEGRGGDLVLEATNAAEGFQHAVEAARIGGQVVMVGIPEGNRYEVAAARARRKGLTIRFSRRMRAVYARAIHLVQEGHVMLEPLVTHRAPLAEAPAMLARQSQYADEIIKATIYQASAG